LFNLFEAGERNIALKQLIKVVLIVVFTKTDGKKDPFRWILNYENA
jgi:hypothetical protein